jgi:serine/threonine protein kinase
MGADVAAEEQFGPYLVYERLGVGGMATVHRALERGIEGFERIVALKRLLPHLAEDASFIKSFVREAKLASLLNHHNIVQIYELGRVGTEYFISMEYIDGRDIRRILRHARKVSGAPPIHVTVGILLQLAEALDYAHTKSDDEGRPLGLVHRDISPSNLIVNPAGHLKVIDFGIARAQSAQLRTQTGRVKGKMAYLAPEAISSAKDLDARSDLWAVGVIAHELLTARPLFARKNEYETLLKVQRGDVPPPSKFNEGCPAEIDAVVMKLLARDPDARFLDAASLREALLDVRGALKLATGTRDVATWLTWAFSLDTPGGFALNTADRSAGGTSSGAFELSRAASLAGMSAHVTPTPHPRKSSDEDEAVEIAWGGGEDVGPGMPIELDDVPDVSGKHLAATTQSDDHDDIPAPEPSHGVIRPKRDTDRSVPAIPVTTKSPYIKTLPPPELEPRATPPSARADTLDIPSSDEHVPRTARAMSEMASPRDTPPTLHSPLPPTALPDAAPPERKSLADMVDEDGLIATQPRPIRKERSASRSSASQITIGDAIVARQSVRSRAWIWILALVVLGAGGVAFALFGTGGGGSPEQLATTSAPAVGRISQDTPKVEPPPPRGTLRFVVEPPDVAITVVGVAQHQGSPWSIEVAPGQHHVELRRAGFKPRVTTIELSPNETQTLLVNLVRAPRRVGGGLGEQAMLLLDSEPQGLEVMLDGRVISDRTPVTRAISVGKHDVGIRQGGIVVWRQHVVAEADGEYEFRPVFSEQKKRERQQRVIVPDRAPEPVVVEPVPPTTDAATPPIATVAQPDLPPDLPPAPPVNPPPPPVTPPRVVGPVTKPTVVPQTGPLMVAPNAVKRVSGETPTLGASKPQNMPPVVSSKVCIDTSGAVTGVEILTKLERHTTSDLAAAIKTWRYAPYKQDGAAAAACFSVNFRVK